MSPIPLSVTHFLVREDISCILHFSSPSTCAWVACIDALTEYGCMCVRVRYEAISQLSADRHSISIV
uniref:Uncharacterized protein n=1 Tax=Onchocerca volvulus TaxID=6282 RepID=A0A8R1XP43_ONCVO